MNRRGIALKFVLIGIAAVSLVLVGLFAYLYQSANAKCAQLQAQVDELTARERVTEGKLEASKKQVSELTLKLQEAKSRIDLITEDLENERSARENASRELEQIKTELDQQRNSRQDIEGQLTQAQDEGRKLREQLKVIEQQKKDLEAKIKDLESGASGVELGKVVVNNDAAAPAAAEGANTEENTAEPAASGESAPAEEQQATPASMLEGKVTVVNKEYNFVVINLGQRDGVNVGDIFSVYQDDKPVGEIKVEKVHESMSAAGFPAEMKDTIKENDRVVQKAK
jgi:predicted RNase H-like nuclease (RuvC/YqgF family)